MKHDVEAFVTFYSDEVWSFFFKLFKKTVQNFQISLYLWKSISLILSLSQSESKSLELQPITRSKKNQIIKRLGESNPVVIENVYGQQNLIHASD